jgi:mono/diheme cytochrome c family protein
VILKAAILFLYLICSLIGHPVLAYAQENSSLTDRENTYQRYCTPCHGNRGDGNGFNAQNLDPRPANHTDAVFMSKRTDKELFDAISGGGRAVGKAAIMPPWGNTLDKAQIISLVRNLRKLCGCKGE